MSGAVSALYERMIERDLDAIPAAAREFSSDEELFLAVARFAILAYAPSLHAKHAVLAALSAYELREAWPEVLIEVARYAAESRQPWSEPPILDPPSIDDAPLKLRDAVDRLAAEKWLAAHMNTDELLDVAADRIDAFLITSAAVRLADVLGEKGRYAALRIGIQEIWSAAAMPPLWAGEKEDLKDQLLANTMAERGSIESVNSYLLYEEGKSNKKVRSYLASLDLKSADPLPKSTQSPIYRLARDFGHHLRACALKNERLQSATSFNLEHGDSMASWSFA